MAEAAPLGWVVVEEESGVYYVHEETGKSYWELEAEMEVSEGWWLKRDEETGLYYYAHRELQVSQWVKPEILDWRLRQADQAERWRQREGLLRNFFGKKDDRFEPRVEESSSTRSRRHLRKRQALQSAARTPSVS